MIIIPENETRTFKYGKLDNNMKYTIICDPYSDISNVVMSVGVGSLNDPNEYMGLAHFLEHMLFMGSKKYVDENYFSNKINEYGGSSNAYTDSLRTVYYFNVLNDKLDEIIDIFAHFFIDPLFNINAVEREINAVNSEHLKNLNNDFWITRQLIYNLTDKNHIVNKFSTGSKETLGSNFINIRNIMIDFYKKYYCSNNMCLTIQSNKPIKDVEKIIKTYFSDIKEKIVKQPLIKINKFNSYLNEYQLKPVMNDNSILYFWEIPDETQYIDDKIIHVIKNTILINCVNNLEYVLKNTNLVSNIDVYYLEIGIFVIHIIMHPHINFKKSIPTINNIVRSYIDNFKNLDWKNIYNYNIEVTKLIYNYRTKENNMDIATNISLNMHYYKEENVYNGGKLIIKPNYDKFKDILKYIDFNKVNILYITKDKLCSTKMQKDKYYKKYYCKLKTSYISKEPILYKFNIHINKELLNIKPKVIHNLDKYNIPSIINSKRFWYGGISKFNEPIVIGIIYIPCAKLFNTCISSLITIISIDIINYYIEFIFCNEKNIGYDIYLNVDSKRGLVIINISGYNYDYINKFNDILNKISKIEPSNEIIKSYIKLTNNQLNNIDKISPWEFNNMLLTNMMNKYNYYYKEEIKQIKYITEEMIKDRINMIIKLKNLPVVTSIYGNIKKDELKNCITYNLNKDIKINKRPKLKIPHNLSINHPNKDEINNCVCYVFPVGHDYFDAKLSAQLLILSTLIERPVFDELRTKEQLGYLVSSKLILDDINILKITIQSSYNINKIETAIDNFLEYFKKYLKNITNDKFKDIKKSIIDLLLEKPNSIIEMAEKYLYEIKTGDYNFKKYKLIASEVKNISLNDIIKLYHSIIKKRKTILIK